ncbi:MAG: lysostaphin resistance A-like protein [Planctomycetota bacterium]
MTGGEERPDLVPRQPRHWPAHRVPEEHERIETRCASCGVEWWVHVRMASLRLRCDCGGWIDVPAAPDTSELPAPRPAAAPVPRRDVRRSVMGVLDDSGVLAGDEPPREVPTDVPVPESALRHASLETQRRWTNRGILELAGVIAAFWVPMFLFHVLSSDRSHLVYLPLTDLVSGFLVLLVGLTAAHYMFRGLRAAAPRFFFEGALVALALAGLALLWVEYVRSVSGEEGGVMQDLRRELGVAWALVLVGVFPAVFEELGFRGLLQGRLGAIHGRNGAILLQGAAFALAHGITIGLPFHFFGGFYLGWLRARSDSLYPCMLVHLVYNSTLVLG